MGVPIRWVCRSDGRADPREMAGYANEREIVELPALRRAEPASDARRDFVDVIEQIRGIRVDAERAGACKLFLAVAAG